MRVTTKFNLVLISVLSISLVVAGYFSYQVLQKNARDAVVQHAGMMLQAALAIRGYTVNEIRPLLADKMEHEFLPQSVPAYAATQSFNHLRKTHPQYSYKEATLNPTNLKNRAVDWENDLVQAFMRDASLNEVTGVRETPVGKSLYLARPIRIKKPGCLVCHGVIDDAPQTMKARYGSINGFGWKMNEVVGVQVVTVPMSVPIEKANRTFVTFMAVLAGAYLFIIIVLNLLLRKLLIKPITQMAEMANQVSMGKMSSPEFDESGKDEIAVLAASFNRMRRSLQKAIKIIEGK